MSDYPTDRSKPEKPRSEPEIIPPGHCDASPWSHDPGWPDAARAANHGDSTSPGSAVFISVDEQGRTRYHTFTPPGPFTIGVVLALLGLIGAAIVLLAFGLVLFLIPVVAVTVVALALSGRIRTWWRRLTQN
jgi:hypothetical protein